MSKCNSPADLHRRMAEVYDFCKGTVFAGREWECVKYLRTFCYAPFDFSGNPGNYEFALGIVDDKLVWEGAELYCAGHEGKVKIDDVHDLTMSCWSWNPPAPPKPKTVSISVNGGGPIVLVLPDGDKDDFYISELGSHDYCRKT